MRCILVPFFSLISLFAFSQIDNVGSGRAIRFDGVDDYINLGNIMDDLDVPFSVSAWVYIDPTTVGPLPIIVSQDNEPIYNGFWFFVNPTTIWLEMGDGLGENLPVFRRGKMATVPDMRGRWVHVAASVNQFYDVTLFLNGINVGGFASGASMQPMESMSPIDVAKIGYFWSNSVVYRYKGIMDEVRVWNRYLSETEVRTSMCAKVDQNEPGLIGNWRFDETTGNAILDDGKNRWHGSMLGNPTRVFSGAAIGDESVYTYSYTTKNLQLDDAKVTNVKAATPGVHIYKVNSKPSRTNGAPATIPSDYYGIFTANTQAGNTFDLGSDVSCDIYARPDNSIIPWTKLNAATGISERIELIIPSANKPVLDLGPDVQICDQSNYTIDSHAATSGHQFQWNTGANTSTLSVQQSGDYILTLSNLCSSVKDTVNVKFLITPPKPNLGDDEVSCISPTKTIRGFPSEMSEYQFEWQDGSTQQSTEVNSFGTYWLKVKSVCGVSSDTVNFGLVEEPQLPTLDLGPDILACDKQAIVLAANFPDSEFTYHWSTGDATRNITIDKSGLYTLTVNNKCNAKKDTIEVLFARTPPAFDLGDDELLCTLPDRNLEIYDANEEFEFEWQDGSSGNTFNVREFGTFWVNVRSVCGVTSDQITISKFTDPIVIPNVITPNNDALNENFEITITPDASRLNVFNRWGQEVFQSSNYQNNWDGAGISTGVYYYKLYNACIGERVGTVTILR